MVQYAGHDPITGLYGRYLGHDSRYSVMACSHNWSDNLPIYRHQKVWCPDDSGIWTLTVFMGNMGHLNTELL